MTKQQFNVSGEIPTFSWFGGETMDGDLRVSIYEDGTVEIQHGKRVFRAHPAIWADAAETFNAKQ